MLYATHNITHHMKRLRAERGLSVPAMAEALGVKRDFVYKLERGDCVPSVERLISVARALGVSTPRILLKHVLPNVLGPIIVVVSAGLAAVAGSEVFLSFLGIGVQPPTPSLGLMIFENASISVLRTNPHLLLFPVGTLTVLLFTFNLLGDSVNDAFNPRAR